VPFGILTCDRGDTDAVCADLAGRGVDVLRLGALPSLAYRNMTFAGQYRPLSLARLPEGRIPRTVRAVLQERGVDRIVSAGSLNGLFDSLHANRTVSRRRWSDMDALGRKLKALCLEEMLVKADIEVCWLREVASFMAVREGLMNKAPLPDIDLRAAMARAMPGSTRERVASAWMDDGLKGVLTFDTDERLGSLNGSPLRSHSRSMIKIAPRMDHSPLDPPMIGASTLDLAHAANIRVIGIDARRGVISSPRETLALADELGIAIVGVTPLLVSPPPS